MASLATDPVSPELALVCPDVRARALALLAERDLEPEIVAVARPARPPVWLCAAGYATISLVLVLAEGLAAVSALVLLLTLIG